MNLTELMEKVETSCQFDNSNYPGLQSMSDKERKLFSIRHILLHQLRAMGDLSGVIDKSEHGEGLDEENLKLAIKKLFINTLRLAQIADMTHYDLARDHFPELV